MDKDRVMDNIRNAFERSGLTLNELGEGLGYDGPTAKKLAWLLLYRTSDPPHFDSDRRSRYAGCQDKRSGEVITPKWSAQTLKLVPFVCAFDARNCVLS